MHTRQIKNINELPIRDEERGCTDICCLVLWLGFVLTMLTASILMYNRANLLKINFPTDSDYKNCGYELENYPYVYFTSPTGNDITKRVCVNQCPKQGDPALICSPTSTIPHCSGVGIDIYDSQPTIDRLGAFCIPTDPSLRASALISYNLVQKWNFLKSLDVVKWSLLLALALGVVYFLAVQFAPNAMIWIGMIFSGIGLLLFGVLIFLDSSYSLITFHPFLKVFSIVIIACGVLFLGFSWWSSHQIKVSSVFVDGATEFLGSSLSTLLYIPLFILATFGFIALILFQYLSFSSHKQIYMNPNDIYWNGSSLTIWNMLNGVELLWGIFILRDSFNYVISGNAVGWYFNRVGFSCGGPLARLLLKNFGSVVFGAFLNCFLSIPELLFDLLNPSEDGRCKACVNPCFCMCGLLFNTFNLIRTDAYSYVNLAGSTYCSAAKQCQYICHRSPVFEGSQSALRIYRIGSHIMILTFVLILSYFVSKRLLLNNDVSLMALACVFFVTYSIAAYFLLIHLDAAEGIMTSFLTEHQLANEIYGGVTHCSPQIKNRIEQLEIEHERKFSD